MLRWFAVLALACQVQGSGPPSVTAEPNRLASPPSAAPSPVSSVAPATNEGKPRAAPGRALELAGEPLHPGCIFELTQQVNGDIVAHSIYWSIDGANGCNDSNRYHQAPYWERGTFWFDQTTQGDRFGYQLARAIDRETYLLQARVETSGTYASTQYLLVRVGSLLETAIDAHHAVQRKATTLTRLGEASSAADADVLVAAVTKAGARAP